MLMERSFIEIARLAKMRHEQIILVEFDAGISTEIVSLNPIGLYTLPEMYREYWSMVRRQRWYGGQFSKAVEDREIRCRVRRAGTKSNNHAVYEIY